MAKKKTSTTKAAKTRGRRKTPAGRPGATTGASSRHTAAKTATRRTPRTATKHSIVYVLSDSTGNLARHTLAAVLTQFPADTFTIHARSFLDTIPKLEARLRDIAEHPGAVVHAMVSPEAKRLINQRCRDLGLPAHDLTGGIVQFLAHASGAKPSAEIGRLHDVITDEYRRRIRAIEFTLEHDDGLKRESLRQADLVLVGVSRTSKTPTSIYLAQQGYKVANVALASEVAPPEELLALPRNRVVALTIDPRHLVEIRTRRQREWGMSGSSYNDPSHVEDEIAWSRRLFAKQGWPTVDVTDQAIEETAAKVLALVGLER